MFSLPPWFYADILFKNSIKRKGISDVCQQITEYPSQTEISKKEIMLACTTAHLRDGGLPKVGNPLSLSL